MSSRPAPPADCDEAGHGAITYEIGDPVYFQGSGKFLLPSEQGNAGYP